MSNVEDAIEMLTKLQGLLAADAVKSKGMNQQSIADHYEGQVTGIAMAISAIRVALAKDADEMPVTHVMTRGEELRTLGAPGSLKGTK